MHAEASGQPVSVARRDAKGHEWCRYKRCGRTMRSVVGDRRAVDDGRHAEGAARFRHAGGNRQGSVARR